MLCSSNTGQNHSCFPSKWPFSHLPFQQIAALCGSRERACGHGGQATGATGGLRLMAPLWRSCYRLPCPFIILFIPHEGFSAKFSKKHLVMKVSMHFWISNASWILMFDWIWQTFYVDMIVWMSGSLLKSNHCIAFAAVLLTI